MGNELLFLIHSITITGFALIALKLGKEALTGFIATCCILANLFVSKQITLCTLNATSSDPFTIGSVIGLNLLQEYYGKDAAKKALWVNVALLIFYTLMTQFHRIYEPSMCDTAHFHFEQILSNMHRITIASLLVYFFVQYVDYRLYALLKEKFDSRFLIARNYFSVLSCQLLDTVLFTFLGLYGVIDHLGQVMVVSYTFKVVAILLATPCLWLSGLVVRRVISSR